MGKTKTTMQVMIDRKWEGGTTTHEEVVDGFHGMRPWQKRAFLMLRDWDYVVMNAPMGAGKSWEICLLSAYKMKQDAKLRTLIAVPQGVIGNGFRKADILLPGGAKLHWEPKHWICDGNGSRKNTDYVIAWLKSKPLPTDINDRVLVCTHSTLLNVYKRLKESKKLALLKNLMLWIDEAHHVRNTKEDAKKNVVFSNGIGGLVAHAVKSNGSIKVGLATATFFRGDRCTLLTDKMSAQFKRFSLAFDEHLGDMEHLRSFSYKFKLCGPDYAKDMPGIFKSHRGKYIVHIPSPNSNHSTGDKYAEVQAVIDAFKKAYGGRESEQDPGIAVLKGKKGEFKILDLVDEKKRDEKKEFTRTINASPDAMDAIIALGMCKEGFDWVHADRSVIVGSRGSLVDVIQTIGRLFRDTPGKDHVEVIHMLPFSFDHLDKEKHREELNNYLKAVYGSMILEDMIDPIRIKGPAKPKQEGNLVSGSEPSLLSSLVPDESERLSLKDEIGKKIIGVQADADEAGEQVDWDDFKAIVPPILAEHDIPEEHHDELAEHILLMFARVSAKLKGIDVRKVDYEILRKLGPSAGIFDYVSKAFDVASFRELKVAIETSIDYASFERHMEILHTMRANGQPIETADEYRTWVRCGQDYEAVLRLREVV